MEALLLKERPLFILPSLAKTFNMAGAIILQQCHWICSDNETKQVVTSKHDDLYWCNYTANQWQQNVLSWLSVRQVQRILNGLVKAGALIAVKPLANQPIAEGGKQTNWYRVNAQKVKALIRGKFAQGNDCADYDKMSQSTMTKCRNGGTDTQNTSNSVSEANSSKVSDYDKMSQSSILDINLNTNIQECGEGEAFSGSEEGDSEELKSASLAEPTKKANGIDLNQEIPAETKFSAAPPENLTKEERFSWWGKHLEDPAFLRQRVTEWRYDYKFLQAFGAWLLKTQPWTTGNGYTALGAANVVTGNTLTGEKAANHRFTLATYLCQDADQSTTAHQIEPQAPKADAVISVYAHLTDSEVTAQFLTYWQEAETGAPMLRPRLKNAYEIGYAEEMHRRNPQWDGKTLAQLVEINNQLATA